MITAMVFAMAVAAAGESVATVFVATGLDDNDALQLRARIDAQVVEAGGTPLALSSSFAVKRECLDDPTCAGALLRAANAPWLLWVEALRAGPKLQIDARLLDAQGRTVKQGGGVVDLDDVLAGRGPVPVDVLGPLTAPPTAGAGAPPQREPEPATPQRAPAATPARTPPPPAAPAPASIPPPLAIAGVAVAAVGAGVSVACLALVPGQLDVINDARSLGSEKETAAFLVPVLALSAVGGALVAGVGGAMVFLASE